MDLALDNLYMYILSFPFLLLSCFLPISLPLYFFPFKFILCKSFCAKRFKNCWSGNKNILAVKNSNNTKILGVKVKIFFHDFFPSPPFPFFSTYRLQLLHLACNFKSFKCNYILYMYMTMDLCVCILVGFFKQMNPEIFFLHAKQLGWLPWDINVWLWIKGLQVRVPPYMKAMGHGDLHTTSGPVQGSSCGPHIE